MGSNRREHRGKPRVARADEQGLPERVYFSFGRIEGVGVLRDVSATGARIAATRRLPPGLAIEMYFVVDATRRLRASAEVVRTTASGFVARFLEVEPDLERLIAEAAARSEAAED